MSSSSSATRRSSLPHDDSNTTPWPSPPDLRPSRKGRALRGLVFLQTASGVAFSSFLLVHLIPPTMVALSGNESSGSAFMLLGKVYYQGALEPLLVYGTVGVHLASSIVRRLFYPRSLPPLGNPTSHSISGFLLAPLLALHVYIHRWVAASSAPPISQLSPSETDLSFVAHAAATWPWISTLTYGGLVALGVWHGLGGLTIAAHRWGLVPASWRTSCSNGVGGKRGGSNRRDGAGAVRLGGSVAVVGLVGLGVVRLARGSFVTRGLATRIEAVHRVAAPSLYA